MGRKKNRQEKESSSRSNKTVKKDISSGQFLFDVDSELRKAIQYHQAGKLQGARAICERVLQIDPNYPHALHLLGVIAYQVGETEKAIKLIIKAIKIDPRNPICRNDLGSMLHEQGKLKKAISCFQEALQLRPDLSDAYNNMGNALQDLGELREAISCYHKALQIEPAFAEAHNNMGNALQGLGRSNRAIACYHKALQLRPNLAEAYNNMGIVFGYQSKPDEAIACYQKALQLRPDYPDPYNNMGIVFGYQSKPDEAIACYQKALHLRPDSAETSSHLVGQLQRVCGWQEVQGLALKLDDLTKKALQNGTKPPQEPGFSVTICADPSLNFAIARSWSSDIAKHMSSVRTNFSFDDRRSPKTKVAIGYVSNDFRNHATGYLMLSLFGLHDRDEFEISCYSYGVDDGSYYRARIQKDCDRFVDVSNLDYADAAQCVYDDEVDILVDLKGFTQGSRLAICALRPAPIQVAYLGFPGTTGADFFDYIITDRIVSPEDHAPYYSESFVYLPHSYQVNDHAQSVSNQEWKKEDVGLPEGSFVFCSFNWGYKIDRIMFDVWMKILRQVPGSVLWLLPGNEMAEKNLRKEAEARDVKPERLIFADRLPKDQHLARLSRADLALDTRICNGHTTTSDALWANVPVLTLEGSHFASRVSASILTAIGLPELITHSLDEYEALAVRLAQQPARLQAILQRLTKNRSTEPLFDTPRFVRNLEKAYKEIWKIFLVGETPRQIEVMED
jgi:protein O-GlcNAc transferase